MTDDVAPSDQQKAQEKMTTLHALHIHYFLNSPLQYILIKSVIKFYPLDHAIMSFVVERRPLVPFGGTNRNELCITILNVSTDDSSPCQRGNDCGSVWFQRLQAGGRRTATAETRQGGLYLFLQAHTYDCGTSIARRQFSPFWHIRLVLSACVLQVVEEKGMTNLITVEACDCQVRF
jgi:hypothetical protein